MSLADEMGEENSLEPTVGNEKQEEKKVEEPPSVFEQLTSANPYAGEPTLESRENAAAQVEDDMRVSEIAVSQS